MRIRARTGFWASLLTAAGIAGCGGSSNNNASTSSPPPPPPPAASFGLDARPVNATCLAPDRQTGTANVMLEREFASLAFASPLGILQAPGDPTRWFVLEKGGRIRVFSSNPATTSFLPNFIDLAVNTAGEGGLLGMAFHPDYQTNGEVFLSWTEGSPMTSVIARFTVNAGGDTLDPGSREDLLRVVQDFSNHNGGQISFGPDGYLYIGFGDGGSGGDPLNRAQETRNLLGAMLRIDVDGGTPYAIPADNPFAGNSMCRNQVPDELIDDCPEIYAWGLRNPWRFSFDSATGDLWAGDVGQNSFEEIDRIELGGNYGWDCREGNSAFSDPSPSCSAASGLIDPVHDYPRTEGVSVTGGYVYRGSDLAGLTGSYLFGDFGSGRLWRLVGDGMGGLTDELLLETGLSIASFGEANDGEIYLVDFGGGLYRLAPDSGAANPSPVPDLLSDTGCVLPADPSEPADGLIPYAVNAPFWSDGADKERWLAIPDGTDIDIAADGDFLFPSGSVLLKQFRLGGDLIETRLLMQHPDGVWAGYSYRWDALQNDGVLVAGGLVENIQGQDWIFPSTAECSVCHTSAAGHTLGLETLQLNGDLTYPSTGRTANQLSTLDSVFVIDGLVGEPATLDRLADPLDASVPLTARARSYLHTNCAQCHRPGGPTPTDLDLRFDTALAATEACDAPPQNGDLGLGAAARIIAPGNAAESILLERMSRRDANAMPPLASNLVDANGVNLIESWIDSLTSCL